MTSPVAAFRRLCGDDDGGRSGFLLESVDHGGQWGRWSFVGRDPRARLVARHGQIRATGDLPSSVPLDSGVLAALEALVEHFRSPDEDELGVDPGSLPPLHSGVVGYLGYDVVREVERLPDAPTDDTGRPDAVLSVIGELAAYDHFHQQVTLVANAFVEKGATNAALESAYDEAVARLDRMTLDGARPLDEPLVDAPRAGEVPAVRSSVSASTFAQSVEVAKEHILAGDIFQVVLSQRFDVDLAADPLDVYRVLRRINPSPYMFYVREDELTLVGCSPEPMVQVLGGRVVSRPIAGTRFRGTTEAHDRQLAAELVEHPKERAEHLMLVDLARNDVGRVVEFGSCVVDEFMTLERYSHVMHLTSQVSGQLAEGRTPIDVLRATLPAGTVSGAPKVRAMEIIDQLEPTRRGPYAGVVGYLDFSGNIDTAIAIRTMVIDPPGEDGLRLASVQAGAGIVADSVAADEELETRNKAKALLCAVPAAEAMTAQRRAARTRIEP
jgi:anthranilate synthase component I